MNAKRWIFGAVLVVSVLLNLYLIGCYRTDRWYRIENDTIVVRDTVRVVEPIHVKETIVRYDTVFFPVFSELERNEKTENLPISGGMDSAHLINEASKDDSIRVIIPITQRVYEDSLYKAWVSGYEPRLDSLHLYRKEVYYPIVIEKKVRPKVVVSAGVYGGFGVKGADYGLGISVGVPIWLW